MSVDRHRGRLAEIRDLAQRIGREVRLMEVCGTHTTSIFRNGIHSLLPETVRLISGPGCPVCVTAQRHIDAAVEVADRDDVIVATYGDMVRVPGKLGSLERQRGRGADVRVVNSTMSANVGAPLFFGNFSFTGTWSGTTLEGIFFFPPGGGAGPVSLTKTSPVESESWGAVKERYH